MVATLSKLGRGFDGRLVAQQPDLDLARYLRHVHSPRDSRSRLLLEAGEGYSLLVHGDAAGAEQRFREVKQGIGREPSLADDHQLYRLVREYLAIACLRRGEQDNCVMHHTSQSCLLPIRGTGMHSAQSGARDALVEYRELLSESPGNMTDRWLYNVAAMALGQYPDSVPQAWRIDPKVFAPEDSMGRFLDVAPALGLATSGLGGGCVLEDFDGDGYIDVMTSSFGLDPDRDQLRYYHNDANGQFSDRTTAAGLDGLVGGVNLVQGDFDNDGHPDVFVMRGGGLLGQLGRQPSSLLRNRGDGTFEDVTERSGLLFFAPTATAAWADVDNDGWLDLFVGIQSSELASFDLPLYQSIEPAQMIPCKLFHNNRDGTFTDIAPQMGIAVTGYVQGAAFGDADNDGWQDLVVTQRYGPVQLFHNDGGHGGGFTRSLVLEPNHGTSAWWFDADNDGWLDLFVGGYSLGSASYAAGQVASDYLGLPSTAERPRLYRNRGDGTFDDVTARSGLGRAVFATGGGPGDFDNDGWPDVYVGTGARDYRALIPNRMFRNLGDGRFRDVTTAADVGHLQKTAAVAVGDVDNDGTPDLYATIGGEFPGDVFRNALFLNPGSPHHWVTMRLEGTRSNRSALGARVRIALETPTGERQVHALVSTGGSYGGSTLQVETGLGDARSIAWLEVRWPATGLVERYAHVPMDRVLRLREGSGTVQPVELVKLKLRDRSGTLAGP